MARRRKRGRRRKLWSARVTAHESAREKKLPPGLFKRGSAKKIARTLKRVVRSSKKTGESRYQSAASMLNFYINRAGRNLSAAERRKLEKAKRELARMYQKQMAEIAYLHAVETLLDGMNLNDL